MATITKRANGWSVQIRRKGHPAFGKTFKSHSDAQAWARQQEADIDAGKRPISIRKLGNQTLGDLIDRYLREITPRKLSADTEMLRLRRIRAEPIAKILLREIQSSHFAAYRDERLQTVRPGTIRRELGLLHHMFELAYREWAMPIPINPLKCVTLPKLNNGRSRRLSADEQISLLEAVQKSRNRFVQPIVQLAIETGLRRREILELEWGNIDLIRKIAFIPRTKTGTPRTIPLTRQALAVIEALPRSEGRLFPISANAFKLAWRRVQVRSGLKDLRFHDLRHEALSRFCELGLSIPELAVISGHRDPRMLFRYAHLRADALAVKLETMSLHTHS